MIPRSHMLFGALALLPVLALLIGIQVHWLRQLEDARGAEMTGVLERSVARIAEALDAELAARPAGDLDDGQQPTDVSAEAIEAAIRDVLGTDALETYRVEIIAVDGEQPALYRSHQKEERDPGPPIASAPVLRRRGSWVGFLGEGEDAVVGGWQEVDLPLEAEPARWLLVLRHREGSLAEVMARGRIQNLVIGGGLLAVLVAGVVFLLVGAQRARRLAERELLFVAGVSHELRTPLTVIRTAASNLEEGVTTESQRVKEYGALIGREAERVGARIERALRFADREEGTVALDEVAPGELIAEAVESCQHWSDRRSFAVETSCAANLPRLLVDRSALVSALGNLLDNAIKYGSEGQVVRIGARRTSDDQVIFEVQDEGPGVERSDRARIFQAFYRAPGARLGGTAGAGLGLAVVERIARDHGGAVRLEEAEQGARFSLWIPMRRAAASETQPTAGKSQR